MGASYTNLTVRGATQRAVADLLLGRRAVVGPARDGFVVVFDERSDQEQEVLSEVAEHLSSSLKTGVLALLVHDDDILWYRLYDAGQLADEFDSAPGYFDADAEPSPPAGGDPVRLAAVMGARHSPELETTLRRSGFDDDGYVFESDRHADLARLLGIPRFAIGTAFASFERGEIPDGLSAADVIRTD
jgi:hypothetical protein